MMNVQSLEGIALDCLVQNVLPIITRSVRYHPISSAPLRVRRQVLREYLQSASCSKNIVSAIEALVTDEDDILSFDLSNVTYLGQEELSQVMDILMKHGRNLQILRVCNFKYSTELGNKILQFVEIVPNLQDLMLNVASSDLVVTVLKICRSLKALRVLYPICKRSLQHLLDENGKLFHDHLQELRLPARFFLTDVVRLFPNLKILQCDDIGLNAEAPKIESLEINFEVLGGNRGCLATLLPNLKSLTILPKPMRKTLEYLKYQRSLRSLYLKGRCSCDRLAEILPTLSGLEELTLHTFWYLNLYEVVKHCPPELKKLNLLWCRFLFFRNDGPDLQNILPSLRDLNIKGGISDIDGNAYLFFDELTSRQDVCITLED